MQADVDSRIEEDVRQRLLELADDIGSFVLSLEAEIDKTMLNAAVTLREADNYAGGRLVLADLERLRRETGMSDLYLGDRNGIFTLSTEPGAAGISLFDIWDGYRMLVTGESSYLPSNMKIKVETGEIFKFTAIPRLGNRGVLESALNANAIETRLQTFINGKNGIKSVNFFDNTLLVLTSNTAPGAKTVYTKGAALPPGTAEVADLFNDSSKIRLSLDRQGARLYYPVIDQGSTRYVLFIDFDTSDYFALGRLIEAPLQNLVGESVRLNMISLAAVFAALIFFTLFIAFLISRLLRPLGYFGKLLASFSAGDFSLELPQVLLAQKDEMGEMARSFKNALGEMNNLVKVIRNQGNSLKDIGEELADNMSQTAEAINQIAGNIKNMKGQTEKQAAVVTETGGSVNRIIDGLKDLNGHIGVQTGHVSRSSEAIQTMLHNIHQVVETLTKNADSVTALAGSSEVGRTDLQNVSRDIQEIARESEGLLEINGVMENIANQTNLLAMNAAIEAAHAGEAGRGFAVVAGEIRKLAENSGGQSKTISTVLKKIKESIDTITHSTAVVLERFETIEQEIKTVSVQEQAIHRMMEEQESGSRQVLETISALNSISGQVKQSSADMEERSREVLQESVNLEGITGEISNGMNEMAMGADQISGAVLRVNGITGKNKDSIDTLSREISKFKVSGE
jgi:methyl-accepting chemotaxis protein